MKSVLLVVLFVAAATGAVVSNEVPDVADGYKVFDVDVNETPEVVVTDVDQLADAAERLAQTAVATPRQQSWGTIGSSDRLLYNATHSQGPRNITIRVGSRISAIRVTPVDISQNVRLLIVSGGVGNNHVTFRVQAVASGRRYNVRIEIYGR